MERRLDLAAALVHQPEVLFLDEPTTGLDPASRLTVWDEVRRINERGHDGVPHHAVPRGGRPALRPARDHRRRSDRARGHAGGSSRPTASAAAARAEPPSTTCSSTPPAARASGRPARSSRWRHERLVVLGQRALREALRHARRAVPDDVHPALLPGRQLGPGRRDLPVRARPRSSRARATRAFQLPSTLLLAASFGTAALFLVEEIEGGYFDKLRATPVPRYGIVLGRLVRRGRQGPGDASVIVLVALPFGINDRQRRGSASSCSSC